MEDYGSRPAPFLGRGRGGEAKYIPVCSGFDMAHKQRQGRLRDEQRPRAVVQWRGTRVVRSSGGEAGAAAWRRNRSGEGGSWRRGGSGEVGVTRLGDSIYRGWLASP